MASGETGSLNFSLNKIRVEEIESADKSVFFLAAVTAGKGWEVFLGVHSLEAQEEKGS